MSERGQAANRPLKWLTCTKTTAEPRMLGSSNCRKNLGNLDMNSTINDAEIKRFSAVTDWWDPEGSMSGLHTMNTVRVPFVRDGLLENVEESKNQKPLKNKKILDVGCGAGILSESLAKLGADVTGIDVSMELISLGEAHKEINPDIAENKPQYIFTTIEDHANVYKDYYDGIVASEVIEHVDNPKMFVKTCVEALKPGGKIFLTTPSKTRLSQLVNIWLAENVIKTLPKETHQYEKFLTPSEVQSLLETNGCRVECIRGFRFNVFRRIWTWSSSTSLYYAIQALKENKHL